MAFYLLFIAVPILGLLAFLLAGGPKDKNGYSWIQFFAKGKDAGFSLKEIELLRRVAVRAELEDPSALFWSVKQLDLCIKAVLRRARLTGQENSLETQDFLSRLYEFRKKIEFEQPRYRKGIVNSRSIAEGQRLRLLVEGAGVFESSVLRNSDRFVTISRPLSTRVPQSFSWKGKRIAVYFWRHDDAGYVFDTYALDEVSQGGKSVLQLSHSDSLFRAQKRRSVRAKTRLSAYLYLPKDEAYPELVESEPGMRCIVDDLSEDGCALTIGGRAAVGLRVKVQFELANSAIAFSGVVRSSEYDEESNKSKLHIEALPLTLQTRNRILAEVFGVNPDAELEAAFAIFDEDKDRDLSVESALQEASRDGAAAVQKPEA